MSLSKAAYARDTSIAERKGFDAGVAKRLSSRREAKGEK